MSQKTRWRGAAKGSYMHQDNRQDGVTIAASWLRITLQCTVGRNKNAVLCRSISTPSRICRLTLMLFLQGKFRAGESMADVKRWVDSCINTPDRIYNLSTMPPVRKVTDIASLGKSLNELGMAPATLVNFFWADGVNEVGLHIFGIRLIPC